MAKIELPEGWAGMAELLRALTAELDRRGHVDRTPPPDLTAVSARWVERSRFYAGAQPRGPRSRRSAMPVDFRGDTSEVVGGRGDRTSAGMDDRFRSGDSAADAGVTAPPEGRPRRRFDPANTHRRTAWKHGQRELP